MRRLLQSLLAFTLLLLEGGVLLAQAPVPANHIRIHYHRSDNT